MNIVFIIGNGFDLNLGLKTKYTDVYKDYCKTSTSDSELIRRFKKEIASDYDSWSDFEMAMPSFGQNLNNESEFITCIRDLTF